MALSRFWTWMLLLSVGFALYMLFSGGTYSLGVLANGDQGDALLVAEQDTAELYGTPLLQDLHAGDVYRVEPDSTRLHLNNSGVVQVFRGKVPADGLFPTCKNTITDIWLPLIGYLTFFCGLLNLLVDAKAMEKLARFLAPIFHRIFPDLRKDHPAYGFMTLNFAANFLGLDSAATPFGLKAMESMQADNPQKERATNSQIMFLCLHAAGLTLLPASIIGYRAAKGAANPADIMVPLIITSFVGTLAAMILVSIRQRINLLNLPVVLFVAGIGGTIAGLMAYLKTLTVLGKSHFTDNLSNALLLIIIALIIGYAFWKEKYFTAKGTNLFDSFIHGAKDGFTTGLRVLPYMIAMLAALSIFRNSGLMGIVMEGISWTMAKVGVGKDVIDAMPVALMRPFSAGGARGFLLDAMQVHGADTLTGRLVCLFQGAAETTFYVVALYFGSVSVKNSRYALGVMLLVDLVCVITAVIVCKAYF